jgi:geranylgeranyl diphosphate synthase type I
MIERQVELLANEIELLLATLPDAAGLYDLAKEPLTKRARALAAENAHARPWPLLPLTVCQSISGHFERALPAAAALQFLMAAGDVFDDIEDADSPESLAAKYGSPVATNVGTTLLILAERAIGQLKARGVEDHVIIQVMDTINSYYTCACAGQHLDLSLSSEEAFSEEVYLRVTGMKSASQVECACRIGTLLAIADQHLIDAFTMFGHNLGMAAQVTNDIHGIVNGTDIISRKITLPLVYALAQADDEVRSQLRPVLRRQSEFRPDPVRVRDLLFRTGAVHYAIVKMESYRQQASDILSQIGRSGANVEVLKLFLE